MSRNVALLSGDWRCGKKRERKKEGGLAARRVIFGRHPSWWVNTFSGDDRQEVVLFLHQSFIRTADGIVSYAIQYNIILLYISNRKNVLFIEILLLFHF